MYLLLLVSCFSAPPVVVEEEAVVALAAQATDCSTAKNTCPDYAIYWMPACPAGARCLTFKNLCAEQVSLTYQVGCNGSGAAGAPQCSCTDGPVVAPGAEVAFEILDGDYTSCLPSWKPACLTAGLAVLPNAGDCTKGTRIEFTAGNQADPYGRFDSYDIDVEKDGFSVPVAFRPDLTCASDHANHDCRPMWCDSVTCPDAYATPTTGGCPDGRSPQAGCQDTFADHKGYVVEFCPVSGASCQDAVACQVTEP